MSPVRKIAAGLALAAIATFVVAAPASAHDQLVSSTPAADERLATPPENITMTFSGDLLVLDESLTGAVVVVVDASGEDWVVGDAVVSGRTVTASLAPGMPPAGYQVRWQVVSEDGHPVAGVVPFTVGDAEPMTTATATGEDAPDDASEPSEKTDQTAESSGALRVLLIGAGGAAVAVLVLVLVRFLRRPRTAAAPPEAGGPAADDL